MSTASTSRTIKVIDPIGAINTMIQCNRGDVVQRYKGSPTAPTAYIPDFTTMTNKPLLNFVVSTSQMGTNGSALADISDFKFYVNGAEIAFALKNDKLISVGIKLSDGTVNTGSNGNDGPFHDCFELIKPSGVQLFYGIRIIGNLVEECDGTSARVTMEGTISRSTVSTTASADFTIVIAEQTGADGTQVIITAGDANCFTITAQSGTGSQCKLKATVYDSDGSEITNPSPVFTYEWYKLNPQSTGADPFTKITTATEYTGAEITVFASDVDTQTEYKVVVRQSGNIVGSDVQKVTDASDVLTIDPGANPSDETINMAGNQTVTYNPTVVNRKDGNPEPDPGNSKWKYSFILRGASGTILNTETGRDKSTKFTKAQLNTTPYVVTVADALKEHSAISVDIFATDEA